MNNRKKHGFLYGNKGAALISVMIAVTFVTILASSLLYISYTNYQMKTTNLASKDNFYEANGELVKVTSSFRSNLAASGSADTCLDPYVTADGKYKIDDIVKLAYPEAVVDGTNPNCKMTTKGEAGVILECTNASGKIDKYEFSSPTRTYTKEPAEDDPAVTVITLKDFQVKRISSEGYENRVETDVELRIKEVKSPGVTGKGGVGEFSMILDSSIDFSSSSFNTLVLTGNSYISQYAGVTDVTFNDNPAEPVADANYYYVKPGTAITMRKEAKLLVTGDYFVVFGDIHLYDNTCFQVKSGTELTVYGDIYLHDNAKFICPGATASQKKLHMMTSTNIPGRSSASVIKCDDGNAAKHLVPSDMVATDVKFESYQNFCKTVHLRDKVRDELTDNDKIGLISQLMHDGVKFDASGNDKPYETSGGTKIVYNNLYKKSDREKFSETVKYYDQDTGVFFTGGRDSWNAEYKNRLMINFGRSGTHQQTNLNATYISKEPIKIDQAHDIVISRVGGTVFDFLNVKSKDTNNIYYDSRVHNFKYCPNITGATSDLDISAGDFFRKTCNQTVNDMLNYASGSTSEGISKTYSSLQFMNFDKDHENR